MSLLPPSTNHLSRGSLASVWFLGLYSLLELITGLIHFFLPDGGAGVIAGLDLSDGATSTIMGSASAQGFGVFEVRPEDKLRGILKINQSLAGLIDVGGIARIDSTSSPKSSMRTASGSVAGKISRMPP